MPQLKTSQRHPPQRIAHECYRFQSSWTPKERDRRRERACRRQQQVLWPLLCGVANEAGIVELWAVGSVSAVDLARMAD
jgi:hypothetical protein